MEKLIQVDEVFVPMGTYTPAILPGNYVRAQIENAVTRVSGGIVPVAHENKPHERTILVGTTAECILAGRKRFGTIQF